MRLKTINYFIPLFVLITNTVCAGERIDRTIDVPATGSLYIENTRGTVIIKGWNEPRIKVTGELDDASDKIVFKNLHDRSLIKVKVPRHNQWGDGSNLVVHMPTDLLLGFKGIDTSFDISDLTQGIEGHTIKGDLKLSNINNKIELSTVSGDIVIENSSGITRLESVNGEIQLSGLFDKAEIKTMSGDIQADMDDIKLLKIKSFSGDTKVSGNMLENSVVKLGSVSGNISFNPIEDFNATCELKSQFGGDISNKLTDDKPVQSMMKNKELKFTVGNGAGTVKMHTLTGSIIIAK